MLFNSFEFMIFLPVVFLLHWLLFSRLWRSRYGQNGFLAVASCVFYGWWDWRFLGLIFLASGTAFLCGIILDNHPDKRRLRKAVCILNAAVSLGILATYKYFNFFEANLKALLEAFGMMPDWVSLDLVLPVGISFYTFQALAYTIDVYRGTIRATHNPLDFFAFMSFFPQLVAGPIERASNLLPQFQRERTFDYALAVDGMRQILWGLFKKMVVADGCARTVDYVFANYDSVGGLNLWIGLVFFSFQIYGDFSGYSDIAIGCGKLFGIRLMQNFKFPYFSRTIAEFWRKWHVSLTAWFRDYVYIPLGGSRRGKTHTIINTTIVFLLSGFWHGADWSFIAWGAFNAMLFIPLLMAGTAGRYKHEPIADGRMLPSAKEVWLMAVTFSLVVIGRVFFRAESMPQALTMIQRMFTNFSLTYSPIQISCLVYIAIMMIIEWVCREGTYGFDFNQRRGIMRHVSIRWSVYLLLCATIILNYGNQASFIYFQF